jgi:DNA topoisomerase-6 subunit B
MTSEYAVIMNKENNQDSTPQTYLTVKLLKPSLTAYSSRTCVINNRPTVVECGIAYGGDIGSFKLFRFANKIPLLYDEGSDVAKEVISEVEINKMGITKKEVKEQFRNAETRSDRAIDYLPMHIFFHICSTKIPYKTAGKESIAAEGDLKRYMKSCLSDLYRKVSAQIRRELKIKENENKLRLYRHYIPFIVTAISESIKVDVDKLTSAFNLLAERFIGNELQSLSEIPGETNSTLMDNTHVDVINTKDRKTTYLKTKSVPNLGHNKKAIQSQSQKTHQSTSQVTLDSFKQSKGKKR